MYAGNGTNTTKNAEARREKNEIKSAFARKRKNAMKSAYPSKGCNQAAKSKIRES